MDRTIPPVFSLSNSPGCHNKPAMVEGPGHYGDVIMGAIASQITSLAIVYSAVYSDADQRKQQSSASLAFVWGIHREPVNSPHKWPVARKMFPFDHVIMWSSNPQWVQLRSRDHIFLPCCGQGLMCSIYFSLAAILWKITDISYIAKTGYPIPFEINLLTTIMKPNHFLWDLGRAEHDPNHLWKILCHANSNAEFGQIGINISYLDLGWLVLHLKLHLKASCRMFTSHEKLRWTSSRVSWALKKRTI